jgi:hypothetical protein
VNGQSLRCVRYANLHLHNKEIDRAIRACRRNQKYPFRVFGNLDSFSAQRYMARDLDTAMPANTSNGG